MNGVEKLCLSGKVSVITGAAIGIGKVIVGTFTCHGSDVAIIDINKELGEESDREL